MCRGERQTEFRAKGEKIEINIFPIISMANSVNGNLIYSPVGFLMKGQENAYKETDSSREEQNGMRPLNDCSLSEKNTAPPQGFL